MLRRYYADLVIGTLQDHAYAATTVSPEHYEYPSIFASLKDVPPPMLENNYDFESECLTGEALHKAAVPESTEVSLLCDLLPVGLLRRSNCTEQTPDRQRDLAPCRAGSL